LGRKRFAYLRSGNALSRLNKFDDVVIHHLSRGRLGSGAKSRNSFEVCNAAFRGYDGNECVSQPQEITQPIGRRFAFRECLL
jgi:hypothetical protein